MTMAPRFRKFALMVHITTSIGWFGAVIAFLALAIAGFTSKDEQIVRAAYLSMKLTAHFAIVPLCFASLLSGLVQSLGTPWGLFRHYWILVKFILTIFATIVLLLQLEPISYLAGVASESTFFSSNLKHARLSPIVHAIGGLVVLLVIITLSVYKPKGMTRYGWRKQYKQNNSSQS